VMATVVAMLGDCRRLRLRHSFHLSVVAIGTESESDHDYATVDFLYRYRLLPQSSH
jgi:hypothetical protein